MGFWSFLTGAKAVESIPTVVDAAVNGIDAVWYTDEEEARDGITRARIAKDYIQMVLKANGIQSIARRIIAVVVVGNFLLAFNVALGFAIAGQPEIVDKIKEVCIDFKMGWAFVTVLSFFFLAHLARVKNG